MTAARIHYLQHVPFENLGCMDAWCRNHALSSSHLYKDPHLPPVEALDWLIVLGGPMGVHDEDEHPWLRQEKQLIRQAIDAGKVVLGICLGAQLVAEVLGAEVAPGEHREIGWFPIQRAPGAEATAAGSALPATIEAFHWHRDVFQLPQGAVPLAASEACASQGFVLDERIVALQFHLESTPASARKLLTHCADELDGSKFVQTASQIFSVPERFPRSNKVMCNMLQAIADRCLPQ